MRVFFVGLRAAQIWDCRTVVSTFPTTNARHEISSNDTFRHLRLMPTMTFLQLHVSLFRVNEKCFYHPLWRSSVLNSRQEMRHGS